MDARRPHTYGQRRAERRFSRRALTDGVAGHPAAALGAVRWAGRWAWTTGASAERRSGTGPPMSGSDVRGALTGVAAPPRFVRALREIALAQAPLNDALGPLFGRPGRPAVRPQGRLPLFADVAGPLVLAAARSVLFRDARSFARSRRRNDETLVLRTIGRYVMHHPIASTLMLADAVAGSGTPERNMRRLTGWSGVAFVALALSQFPLYMQSDLSVSIYDGEANARDLFRLRNVVFTRILLDLGLYGAAMVFAAGLRDLIRQLDPDEEWIGTLVFGAMVVWFSVTLVANGLEGAAALDTLGGQADPSVVRALLEGTVLIYNGSIAFAITGLFLGAAGYATFATGVLPRWTGWVAYGGAALCAASVPAMYGGPVDFKGFYNAGGWGPALIANFPPAIWFLGASISLLRTPGGAGTETRPITGLAT